MPNWPTEPAAGHVWLYMFYNIWFKNAADYEAAVATFGGNLISRSPGYARDALGITETANGWDDVDDTWIQFVQPPYTIRYNIDGSWQAPQAIKSMHTYVYPSDPGNPEGNYWWPPASYTFDYNQDWLDIPGHPSIPIWGAGPPLAWVWVGVICIAGGITSDTPTEFEDIRPRRFITGFEWTNGGQDAPGTGPEGDGGTVFSEVYTRAASRTPDGIGMCCTGQAITRQLNETINPIINGRNSWERFYLWIEKYPTASLARLIAFTDSGGGATRIQIDTTGKLNGETLDNFGFTHSNLDPSGTVLPLKQWIRIDVYLNYVITGSGCEAQVTVESLGATLSDWVGDVRVGGAGQVTHSSSTLGSSVSANGSQLHYDDWSNMDPGDPTVIGGVTFRDTVDYVIGHHCQWIRGTSLSENTNWTGDYRALLQTPPANPLATITSSTTGARLATNTEATGELNSNISFVRQFGPLAIGIGAVVSKGVASVTDKIGSILAGVEATVTKSFTTLRNGYNTLQNIAAGSEFPPLVSEYEPSKALLIKSTDANLTTVSFLEMEAQYMGSYGPEDESDPVNFIGITQLIGYHNSPYYATYMGRATTPPPNSVAVATGTYVGNGTAQDITIALPGIHWLYIRNTSTNVKTWWNSAMLAPHANFIDDDALPGLAINIRINTDGDTVISLVGTSANSNNSGVTYQYVAFSDVMSRILMNVPWKYDAGTNTVTLFDSGFTPEFALAQMENVKNNTAGFNAWIKGPGFTATQSRTLSSATVSTTGLSTFTAGSLIAGTSLNGISGACAALWRQTDGNSINANIIYIGTYIGNGGAGDRVIPVTLNGRRPLFAIIAAVTNANQYSRDPSHTTNNSTRLQDGTGSTTAITGGGVDSIQVGVTLNANLVVYTVFIIPSCVTTAGNGGWGVDGICGLAEPGWNGPGAPTAPSYLLTPPDIPADVTVVGSGGIVLSGETAKLLVENMSGIYTLVPGKTDDTIITGSSPAEADVEIPDPFFKTGYIGG